MTRYIDAHKAQYGVEPICRVLEIAPSTYYAAANRLPCTRQVRDQALKPEIARVHEDNFGVYGAHKVWRQLNREGFEVGRDRVRRLMRRLQLAGVRRGKVKRTTFPGEISERPQDLVERSFVAAAPNRLWVADLTYVSTWTGFVYVAFVVDVFSRRIVGWRVSARSTPSSPSTPWRWPSGRVAPSGSRAWSITPTEAFSPGSRGRRNAGLLNQE
jgi:putative transposase